LLFGDATLMFADATTNTIAEAIRTTWGIDEGPQAWGFERLLKKLRRGEGEGRSPDMGSQIDRLHAVYVAVNVPRHVLAVHPPANQSVEEFRFDRRSPDTMRIGAWNRPVYEDLDTLQSAFNRKYRRAAITSSAYVHADTSEGTAHYVAVSVEGIFGVAVFGTSDPPLQADTSLITAANSAARQLFGSSWTTTGTSAESCL
jgi:hypothetical protein